MKHTQTHTGYLFFTHFMVGVHPTFKNTVLQSVMSQKMPFCHIVQHSKCTRWCSRWHSSSSTPSDQQLWPVVCQSTNIKQTGSFLSRTCWIAQAHTQTVQHRRPSLDLMSCHSGVLKVCACGSTVQRGNYIKGVSEAEKLCVFKGVMTCFFFFIWKCSLRFT